MTLESLKLQNFKRYASYAIEFESGLCGILGRNGSGKSTIFEAVFFALYGEVRGAKELLPTAGANGGVKVELGFCIDEKSYIVTREFRGKNLTAYASLKEGDVSLASGAKEVNAAVSRLLGMGKEAFLRTVFASQKELTALSSMKNEERKAMMRRLLGLEKIDKIEEMIREELRELKSDIKNASAYLLDDERLKELNAELAAKSETAKTAEETLKNLKDDGEKLKTAYIGAKLSVDAMQKAKEERQKKLQTLEKARQALAMREKQLAEQGEELKALEEKQADYTKRSPIKAELERAEKALAEHETLKLKHLKKEGLEKEQKQLRAEYASRKEEAATLIKEIEPLEVLQKLLQEERAHTIKLKASSEKLTEEINKLNSEISTNRSKIKDTQKKIDAIAKLGKESPCPVCTRALQEQYDSVLASLHEEITSVYKKQIDTTTTTLEEMTKRQGALQKELQEAEQKQTATDKQVSVLISKTQDLTKAKARFDEAQSRGLSNKAALMELGEILYDEAAHKRVKDERDALKPQVETLIKLEALIATIPDKTKTIETTKERLTADKTLVESSQKTLQEDAYNEKSHQESIENAKKAEATKDANIAELQKAELEQAKLKKDIEAAQKELKKDNEQRAALKSKESDKNDYEKLKSVMAEFKTHINARVAPRIGEAASEMYGRVTRGKYQLIEVTPDFDFYIYDNGERYPIERFSGGEIDLANLVLRIAVSKTLGELGGGGNIGFLAFDEVFGSQDEERRMEIMDAFHAISESYRQIFLISHEMEIKEMFERVVEL